MQTKDSPYISWEVHKVLLHVMSGCVTAVIAVNYFHIWLRIKWLDLLKAAPSSVGEASQSPAK